MQIIIIVSIFFNMRSARLMVTLCYILIILMHLMHFKMFAAHSRKNIKRRAIITLRKNQKCSKIFTEPCFHKATGSDGFWVTAAAVFYHSVYLREY